ncbi:efflux RND transporter permease subunit [Thermohalobacter berrensis]|uniref:Multidrug ABC transporter n=1 Tax=Thermohalobacter berrensis TaxID=99594 RepID=A0A419T7I7_9FIRM|nr:efflux RND transporter permease subunit [Thermohalobacter berrensis]RKD33520.1 multidrug ABC transporter [Thermohalobacter berrensis]
MHISKLAVKRPVTILMVTFIIILLGAVSLSRLPIDLLPKIEVPVAIVSTSYEGVGPEEIEKLITRPIEESLATVDNIKGIQSISSEGSSVVIAEFDFGTDMDFASLDMREKVDMIKGYLPDDASDPMVLKIDPNSQPIIQLSLSNGNNLASLQEIAEDMVKPRLERLEGVASVSITGGLKKEIEISINQEKLKGYGLTIDRIAQIIAAENLNLPGGEVKKGKQKLTIRTLGEFQSIDEIKNLPITLNTGGVIYLKDIANIGLKHKDLNTIAKTNGKSSINLLIQKQPGTNTVRVANRVNNEIERLQKDFPNIEIKKIIDVSKYIKQSIQNVVKNAALGAILAIIILYLFLRNIRTTLIIGTAIPISIIATFILIYFNDITLNLMTLGGLALGVGMLVDNAIVVLENIYRFRQDGYSRIEAAVKGAKEVGMAVTASTLTTVAVFLPIVFTEGITSTLFKELALTVTMSLGASLLVSLTLIPMLSSKILKVDRMQGKKHKGFKLSSILYDTVDKILMKIQSVYKRILNWSLGHRKSTVLIAILVFVISMASITSVGAEFFPPMDEGQFTISVSLPEGAELEQTDGIVEEIEEKLEKIEEVDIVVSNVGSSGTFSLVGSETNRAIITVLLTDMDKRSRSVWQVADEVRNLIYDIPGVETNVEVTSNMMMSGSGTPINIKIKGDDLDTLKKISNDFKGIVKSVEGTREVETSITEGVPRVEIKIDRQMASQFGLTAAQIASAVKGTISGKIATKYKHDGEEIDVIIKGDETLTENISNLKQTSIQTPLGVNIPLSQVAILTIERGPVAIDREDQVRVASVTSQIFGRDLKSITDEIQQELSNYNMPKGYTYEMGGEREQLNEAFQDLALALILAVVLVYMILASQFESLLHPFTIMLSVPLAFAGGAAGLFITRRSLSVPAVIGFIILAGIVVNNAIVLIDYINTRRRNGEKRKEAILNAGPIRLRPILMTTLTTVLGLLPLAFGMGEGAEAQAPLATAVIGGLLLSTLLTLVFIPVVYTIFDDIANFVKRKIFKREITVNQ